MPASETKRVFVGLLLDVSGSMKKVWKPTVEGFNKQVKAIQEGAAENKVETYVSLYTFNKITNKIYEAQSVNFLDDIAEEDYEPKGDTALYGCINDMIDSMGTVSEEADPNNSYVVYILSDGQETIAKHLRAQTGQRIKEKQDSGKWTFVFMGCDQNLNDVNHHLNIPMGNIANYTKSKSGTLAAFEATGNSMKSYMRRRASGAESVSSFYSESGKITDLADDKLPENMDNIKTFKKSYTTSLPSIHPLPPTKKENQNG